MKSVMRYVSQLSKTLWDGQPLVSGIGCQPETAFDEFLSTKLLHHKDGGVMFYHMVQSFPKCADIDPCAAYEAARQLAGYFEGCEVLVCTHVDREHIHSHCVINSVNFETGKKLHMAKEQLQELMRRNDAICLEMGLPVFEPTTQQARGMSGAEYHTALRGQSWKLRLMNIIDECMKYAVDKDAFVSLMESEGYAVRWESGRKYITYTTPEGMKCRDSKLHEEKYCKEAIEHEFRIRAAGDEQADGAGRRNKLGTGGNSEDPAGAENARRPDAGAEVAHGDAEIADRDEQTAGTGWESERKVFLQVDRLAPGLQPAGGPQVDHAGADPWHGGTGGLVWLGAVIGFAVGAAMAVKEKLDEHAAQEKQKKQQHEQTMGGM